VLRVYLIGAQLDLAEAISFSAPKQHRDFKTFLVAIKRGSSHIFITLINIFSKFRYEKFVSCFEKPCQEKNFLPLLSPLRHPWTPLAPSKSSALTSRYHHRKLTPRGGNFDFLDIIEYNMSWIQTSIFACGHKEPKICVSEAEIYPATRRHPAEFSCRTGETS